MHRCAAWGLSALAAGALAPTAPAADPAQPEKPGLVSRWLGSSDTRPDSEKTFADVPARPPVVVGPLEPVVLADAVRAEKDAWQRRMEVCLKLKQIALNTGNDALAQRADDLEQQATALYLQRTARFGVKSGVRSPAEIAEPSTAPPTVTPPEPATPESPADAPARSFREVGQ